MISNKKKLKVFQMKRTISIHKHTPLQPQKTQNKRTKLLQSINSLQTPLCYYKKRKSLPKNQFQSIHKQVSQQINRNTKKNPQLKSKLTQTHQTYISYQVKSTHLNNTQIKLLILPNSKTNNPHKKTKHRRKISSSKRNSFSPQINKHSTTLTHHILKNIKTKQQSITRPHSQQCSKNNLHTKLHKERINN